MGEEGREGGGEGKMAGSGTIALRGGGNLGKGRRKGNKWDGKGRRKTE